MERLVLTLRLGVGVRIIEVFFLHHHLPRQVSENRLAGAPASSERLDKLIVSLLCHTQSSISFLLWKRWI